jgi:subtilisin family serine protease
VAALNQDRLASFSNWGKESVDIAAPGVGIMSLLPSVYTAQTGMTKTPANGTSMAAPFVSNLAARCLQKNENLKAIEVKKIILATGLKHPELKDKMRSEAEAQPDKALKACELSLEMPLEKALELALSNVIQKNQDTPPVPTESSEAP